MVNSIYFNGWIICNGRNLTVNDYPDLYNIIGTSFGSTGEGFFNIPDCRGRTLGAIGNGSNLTNRNIGDTVGQEQHTLSTTEMPVHSHTGTTDANGTHSHNYQDAYFAEAGGNGNSVFGTSANTDSDNKFKWRTQSGDWSNTPSDIPTSNAGNHTHTFTTNTSGSGNAFNIMQPTLFIGNVFIFTNIVITE